VLPFVVGQHRTCGGVVPAQEGSFIATSALHTQVLAARHRAPASLATILNKQHWALEALRRYAPKRSSRTQSLVLLNPGTFQAQLAG